MINNEKFTRADWEALSPSDRNSLIHSSVMSENGEPREYSTNFGAATIMAAKLGAMYSTNFYPVQGAPAHRKWECKVMGKVESLGGGYSWGAATCEEAMCLATLNALGILDVDDIQDLRAG